jgi:peptide/nickel transport system substrate-binding protein
MRSERSAAAAWRARARLALAGVAAVWLAACGGGEVATDAGAPENPDALRVAVTELPPSLGNPFGANGTPSTIVWYALFDALTRLDADGGLRPALALEWFNDDPLTWRFELRPGVTYTNGRVFDAEAAAAVLRWLTETDAGLGTVVGNEVRNIESVEAIDADTLVVRTEAPDAILPRRMSAVLMVEPDVWAELGPDEFARAPVGTGPYRLETWGGGARTAVAVAHPASWREPVFDRIEWTQLPDAAVRVQALLSDEVDVAYVGPEDAERLRERGQGVISAPALGVMSVALITETETPTPLDDVRVRRALNLAVDKQAITEIVLGGRTVPSGQPASQHTFGYNPEVEPYPYDPARARALLAEAGYPDGFPLTIDVVVGSAAGDTEMYQLVAQYLEDVGIRVRLRSRPFSAWLRTYLSGDWESDAFGLTWNATPYNDVLRPMEYFSCAKANPFFCDPELHDRVLEAAATLDDGERGALLRALAEDYHEAAPAIFLVEQVILVAHRSWLAPPTIVNRVVDYDTLSPAD